MTSARWYPPALRGHAALLSALALLLSAVGAVTPEPSFSLQLALLVPLVLVLGVPHGAVDAAEAERALSPRLGRHWRPVFFALYLALAGLVVVSFAVAPVCALVLFLGVSLLHFGASDRFPAGGTGAAAVLEIGARGSLAVLLPAALHAEEVGQLFAWLAPEAAGGVRQVVAASVWLRGPLLFLILASAAHHALRLAHRGYVMVNGEITLSGAGEELLAMPEVRAAYLEGGHK